MPWRSSVARRRLPLRLRRPITRPGSCWLASCRVLVCLGATAAQALLGRAFKVTRQRGIFVESSLAPLLTATVHPSSILRAPDDDARRAEMQAFVADLKKVARKLASASLRSSR